MSGKCSLLWQSLLSLYIWRSIFPHTLRDKWLGIVWSTFHWEMIWKVVFPFNIFWSLGLLWKLPRLSRFVVLDFWHLLPTEFRWARLLRYLLRLLTWWMLDRWISTFGVALDVSTLELLVAFSLFIWLLDNSLSWWMLEFGLTLGASTLDLLVAFSFLVWLSDDSLSWWMIGFGLAVDTSNLELLVAFPFFIWLLDDSLSWWTLGFGLVLDISTLELLVSFSFGLACRCSFSASFVLSFFLF